MLKAKLNIALLAGAAVSMAAVVAQADVIDIDISGAVSPGTTLLVDLNTELGTLPGGEVFVDGLGWDLEITANDPSWLDEASIDFVEGGLSLSPGAGDFFSGTGSYSSGGILDLTAIPDGFGGFLDLSFSLADGFLTMVFFESFDDLFVDPDATWNGTVSLSATGIPVSTVPEPGMLALLLVAGLGGIFAGSRKKA